MVVDIFNPIVAEQEIEYSTEESQILEIEDTMPPEKNSNDFGVFWNYLADSNSNFVVA